MKILKCQLDKDFVNALNKVLKIRIDREKKYGDSWKNDFITNYYNVKNKYERLKMMVEGKKNAKQYETIEDTLIDLCNYSLFCLALLKRKKR